MRLSALQLAARAVEQRLNADLSDYCGPFRPCPACGLPARYAGRHPKTFVTVLGALTLWRAYYHCPPCGAGCCPRDAALGLDGTGLPVRKSEAAGRPGKQPDGSAKTREAKVVVVWTAESRHPKTGRPQRDPGSASYSAAIESAASRDTDPDPSPFAQRVRREAERRGFPQAQRRVVLGDGAAWIWRIAAEDYPGAIQIVDLFHVKEHLHEVSKALWPDDPDGARLWADVRCDELDDGCLDDVLAVLRSHASGCDKAAGCHDYIENNREHMHYADFRAQGLCVASGVVESGCKRALGTRLKRSGMRWTVNGANAIAALRCCILSGFYEDFWAYRTNRS